MQKIAIYGKATAGKTTLAEAFIEHNCFVGEGEIFRFAGPLKFGLSEMGITKEEHPVLYRQAAQYLGTDLVREYDPNWWVNQMDKQLTGVIELVDTFWSDCRYFVIDDLRFPNELVWCEVNHFLTVKIEVSPETQIARGMSEERMTHPSETALDHIPDMRWKLIIPEDTTVEQRVEMVLAAVEEAEEYDRTKIYT